MTHAGEDLAGQWLQHSAGLPVHVRQLRRHAAVGKKEIPGYDVHVSVFGFGQHLLEKVATLVVRRGELVEGGVPKVVWVVIKHRAPIELIRRLRTVIGEGVTRELPSTGAVVPCVGIQPDRVDVSLLAQDVQHRVDALIDE